MAVYVALRCSRQVHLSGAPRVSYSGILHIVQITRVLMCPSLVNACGECTVPSSLYVKILTEHGAYLPLFQRRLCVLVAMSVVIYVFYHFCGLGVLKRVIWPCTGYWW